MVKKSLIFLIFTFFIFFSVPLTKNVSVFAIGLCGKEGYQCCTNNVCDPNLTCVNNRCVSQTKPYLPTKNEFNFTELNNNFPLKDSFLNKNITNLGDLVSVLIPYIFGITGIILLLMIVFSGFQILTSAGDPKAMEAGQKRLVNAIIGFLVIFLSFWIVKFVGQILGIGDIVTIFGN